jgi:hypothetical protein
MLDVHTAEAIPLDLIFNTKKPVGLRIGPRWTEHCLPLVLANADLMYITETKYLGITLTGSRSFKRSFEEAKLKFYLCFNAVCNWLNMVNLNLSVCSCWNYFVSQFTVLKPFFRSYLLLECWIILLTARAVYRIFVCSNVDDIKFIITVVNLDYTLMPLLHSVYINLLNILAHVDLNFMTVLQSC